MKSKPAVLCTLLLAAAVHAHGGQYRGPGDVVPPGAGGGRPKTPGSGKPGTPGPSVPGMGAPTTPNPGSRGGGGSGAGGAVPGATTGQPRLQIEDDLTRWQFWWEYNKDPFIRLKDAIHTGGAATATDVVFTGTTKRSERDVVRPSTKERQQILPVLKQALDSTNDRDITSSCLIAMAKIGGDHDEFRIHDEFRARLREHDQEIREVATLAYGITQSAKGVEVLLPIFEDSSQGRALVDRAEVDDRTRSFAGYGLGLIAWAVSDVAVKTKVYQAMDSVLANPSITNRNIKVAAIHAMQLLRPVTEDQSTLRTACIDSLLRYYNADLGQGEQWIQAHVPPAVAHLLGREGDRDDKLKQLFANELSGTTKRASVIYQSAALALGLLAKPGETDPTDAQFSKTLQKYWANGRDPQGRYFTLMALGQIGGADNRGFLLRALDQGSKALEKPWAALALGVMTHYQLESGGSPDRTVEFALTDSLRTSTNPETIAAMAVALGLARCIDAETLLMAKLEEHRSQNDLAGYLCIGLALMGSNRAIEDIRNIVASSIRRPDLLKQAAIALGKLGDKSVTRTLEEILVQEDGKEPSLSKLSAVASALTVIGDRRSIEPLHNILRNDRLPPLARAFAAVALGGIGDKEDLPWNSKTSCGMNYRAAVEVLTNGSSGILDIL